VKARVAIALGAIVLVGGCLPRRDPGLGAGRGASDIPAVRVALASRLATVPLEGTGAWMLFDTHGAVIARGRGTEHAPRVEHRGTELRVTGGGESSAWREGPFTLRAARGTLLRALGKSYRGDLQVVGTSAGLLLVNVLPVEEYLRGVVPLEIGPRTRRERGAIEAQAVAARSFAVIRIRGARAAAYDLVAGTSDQVYGGVDAERPESDAAVQATRGLVLLFGGRPVDAPFSAACGGETAAAEEVWRGDGVPHLRRVSDKIPGSDRYYCDIAPRFYWERRWTGSELDAVVARYLSTYAQLGAAGTGRVRALRVEGRTPSGRVADLSLRTSTGQYVVRGNDARSVLRTSAGELLPSSYFSIATEEDPGGQLARLVVRGNGHGHGVGMCQWGAIGRARAGQSARTILRVYYPGTTVGPVPSGHLRP
jgi:stage II sporulation protein D